MSKVLNGIDVSTYQGVIDWTKAKNKIDFAVLRVGYGSDIKSQDDARFERNATECERLNIPFAVYLYSYATTEAMIDSEVTHTLRVIGKHKPFCVYIDMEDNSTVGLGKSRLTAFAKRFCEAVKSKGFKAGVYANQNWFQNYLDVKALYNCGYSIWCAKYADSKPNIAAPYDIWQYSSTGKVDGISGNVDMNYMYNDICNGDKKTTSDVVCNVNVKVLRYGAKGNSVKALQFLLNGYGYKFVPDGIFGNKTLAAVQDFQKKSGIGVDGIVGVKTWGKLLGTN